MKRCFWICQTQLSCHWWITSYVWLCSNYSNRYSAMLEKEKVNFLRKTQQLSNSQTHKQAWCSSNMQPMFHVEDPWKPLTNQTLDPHLSQGPTSHNNFAFCRCFITLSNLWINTSHISLLLIKNNVFPFRLWSSWNPLTELTFRIAAVVNIRAVIIVAEIHLNDIIATSVKSFHKNDAISRDQCLRYVSITR